MRCHHRTWAEYAEGILTNGFKVGPGRIVQLSDRPLESEEIKSGQGGDISLWLEVPEEVLAQYEDKHTHYKNLGVRVFKVPAEIINRYPVGFFESNYVGVPKWEILQAIENAKARSLRLPGAPYNQATVLQKALSFMERVQGDDAARRYEFIKTAAFFDWENDPNRAYWGADQRYWFDAEKRIDELFNRMGGVPFF